MDLRLQRVDTSSFPHLVAYSGEHGPEHDDSFLPGRDFAFSPEQPAFLLWNEQVVVGAVSLMRTRRFLRAQRGRFSIFHTVLGTQDAYIRLLDAIRPHFHDLNSVYLFIPQARWETAAILLELGFHIERYAYVLESREPPAVGARFPEGYAVQPLTASDETGIRQFTDCLNESFRGLAGHIDSSPEDIRAWFDDESYIEGGISLLRHGERPVGTLCVSREDENREAGEVSAFGIIDQHQGRGLGRALLRYARSFARDRGLHPVILSVDAENEAALRLYTSEGFIPTETMVCYSLDCSG